MAREPNHDPLPSDCLPGDPARWALFLDLDGTLIDIADAPDAVTVPDDLPALLAALSRRLDGAVAIVTGRLLADIDELLAPLRMVVAGLHGLEYRAQAGGSVRRKPAESIDAVRAGAIALAASRPGILLEDKGGTLALHYRSAPESGDWLAAAVETLIAAAPGLDALPGKLVIEIKPASVSKYTAVRELMRLPPFAGRVPVFVGDDVTDRDGFRAVREAGGIAIAVADRPDEAATLTLPTPRAVRFWLASLAGGIESREPAPEARL